MIKNYLKIAWRNLIKSKVYSLINITGLAIGMAVAMLIAFWIWDEVSYNRNFVNYDHIIRAKENSTAGADISTSNSVPIPLSVELRTKYASDFKKVVMASWNQPHILAAGEKKLSKQGMYVQPDFTRIFSFNMIKGSLNCLNDPYSIILSQSLAKAMFDNDDPINKTVKIDNKKSLKVTGVFEDFAHNSELNEVSFFTTWEYYMADQNWVKNDQTKWDENSFQIFAQLQDNANLDKLSAKVKGSLNGHDRKDKPEVILHPMSKWHLYTEFKNGVNTGGTIQFVWMFGIIGLFVLLLACINFMNLSTARSEKRAKEVGIRKAVGSMRKQLIIQFLSESVLIAFLSFILAIIVVQISLPFFNKLADKQMHIAWGNGLFWLLATGFTLFTGIIAGSYPAFYLSSFSSVKVLKGTFKAGRFASIPRKVLVVLQFAVSASLIISTIIIYQQIQYAKNRPVGYSRAGLLTVNMNTPDLYGHYGAIRDDLINSGAAADMAESSSPATELWNNGNDGFDWKGKDPAFNASFGVVRITHDFGKTVGWHFKDGRDFSRDYATDTSGMVMNEAAVEYMGLTNPVGETIKHDEGNHKYKSYRVIGVINNMIMESPFTPVKPILYNMDYENANVVIVKINPALSVGDALPKIESVFKKYNPGAPFDYTFADDEYAKKFTEEERIGRLATFFAIFAVFISCLGLFGLASFTAEQRTKEIGVRKLLGASVLNLWQLLSKDFLALVFISFLIAIPVAYYFMYNWLHNYEYRIHISAWVFVATGITAMLITLITVSYQAIKAAIANPVKSLRTE
jgi:putative ABC transport system permease protein